MGEFLFWFHILIIIAAIASGFFLPLTVVLLLIVLHKIHIKIFGDCLLTLLKRYKRVIKPEENFLQYASRRLFKINISMRSAEYINYTIYTLTILASVSRYFL